jgi:tetratricopeptide (TPR) repeat protein
MAKNPVEKRIELLRDLWMEHTEDPQISLVVWRIPDNADRMLQAFFEIQKHPGDWNTEDLFIRFDAPFETSFGYSRALRDTLAGGYLEQRKEQDRAGQERAGPEWPFRHLPQTDTAAGFMAVLNSFAQHHQVQDLSTPPIEEDTAQARLQFRSTAALLDPSSVTNLATWESWIDAALAAPMSPAVRLVLVDTINGKRWDALAARHSAATTVIEAPIDMFDIARETAAQTGAGGSGGAGDGAGGGSGGVAGGESSAGAAVAYRQLLTDVVALLDKGSAAQTSARADKALQIAQHQQWHDQQATVHLAVAGAYIKEQDLPNALARYRNARECGQQAVQARHPVGQDLVLQAWFGEAGAWLLAGQHAQAAQAYCSAAEQARNIPNPLHEIEAYRMAAYCHAKGGSKDLAIEHGRQALVAGQQVAPAERQMTTLALALQDLLRLQDPKRSTAMEADAAEFKAAVAAAHQQAEQQAQALGAQPSSRELEQVENAMFASFEASFQRQRQARENLINGGDEFFRRVVAVGRDLLGPQWNGLPTVKHPMDKDVAEWSEPPQFTPMPEAADWLAQPHAADPGTMPAANDNVPAPAERAQA